MASTASWEKGNVQLRPSVASWLAPSRAAVVRPKTEDPSRKWPLLPSVGSWLGLTAAAPGRVAAAAAAGEEVSREEEPKWQLLPSVGSWLPPPSPQSEAAGKLLPYTNGQCENGKLEVPIPLEAKDGHELAQKTNGSAAHQNGQPANGEHSKVDPQAPAATNGEKAAEEAKKPADDESTRMNLVERRLRSLQEQVNSRQPEALAVTLDRPSANDLILPQKKAADAESLQELLPPDAPPGHPAWSKVKFKTPPQVARPYATFQYEGMGFQTTVAAAGSQHAAEVIARACYVKFQEGLSHEDVRSFRTDCYARLQGIAPSMVAQQTPMSSAPPTPKLQLRDAAAAPAAEVAPVQQGVLNPVASPRTEVPSPAPTKGSASVGKLVLAAVSAALVLLVLVAVWMSGGTSEPSPALRHSPVPAPAHQHTPSPGPAVSHHSTPSPTTPGPAKHGAVPSPAPEAPTKAPAATATRPPATAAPAAAPPAAAPDPGEHEKQQEEDEKMKKELEDLKKQYQEEVNQRDAAKANLRAAREQQRKKKEELKKELAKLQEAQAEKESWDQKAQEVAGPSGPGPLISWIGALPCQWAIAIVLGLVGLSGIIGPSSYTKGFLAIVGSAVGGLMVGSCVTFFSASQPGYLVDAAQGMLRGEGPVLGYLMWAVTLLLGAMRWHYGAECGVYAVVDEVKLTQDGKVVGVSNLQRPLLADTPVQLSLGPRIGLLGAPTAAHGRSSA